jgi:hypothetical protein
MAESLSSDDKQTTITEPRLELKLIVNRIFRNHMEPAAMTVNTASDQLFPPVAQATRPCMCCNRANDDEPSAPHSTTLLRERLSAARTLFQFASRLVTGKQLVEVWGGVATRWSVGLIGKRRRRER